MVPADCAEVGVASCFCPKTWERVQPEKRMHIKGRATRTRFMKPFTLTQA